MTIHAAMQDACRAIGIIPPRRAMVPGRWIVTDTESGANGKGDGRVKLDPDGRGGIAWNHQTQQYKRFTQAGASGAASAPLRRDPEEDRRKLAELRAVEAACARIVAACEAKPHPYLIRKGFPDEPGLVCADPRTHLPRGPLGEAMAHALPRGEGPFLIVPGRIDGKLTTVQVITADGEKKNIRGGLMGGASHRLSTGPRVVVAEGIATALTIRAALRLLSAPATVLCGFAANNVAKLAARHGGLICADHDKPVEAFGGLGTGEYYARRSGQQWTMPPELGDFNDWHQRDGLRAVAVHLREVMRA